MDLPFCMPAELSLARASNWKAWDLFSSCQAPSFGRNLFLE